MSKWRRTALFAGFLLVLLGWHSQLYAWNPLAHYLIAREARQKSHDLPQDDGVSENEEGNQSLDVDDFVENYASLPDYVPSRVSEWWPPYQQTVYVYFCWSHAAKNVGWFDYPGSTNIPYTPAYAEDGRAPGQVMKVLLTEKLKVGSLPSDDPDLWLRLQNTINGFRVHIAADKKVHWTFFWGIPPGDGLGEPKYQEESINYSKYYDRDDKYDGNQSPEDNPKDAWVVHHNLKEAWADYELLRDKVFETGVPTDMFDENGMIDISVDTPDGEKRYDDDEIPQDVEHIPAGHLGFEGDWRLMALAQKVYRKNRRRYRTFDDKRMTPQTEAKIKELVTSGKPAKHTRNWLERPTWAKWQKGVLKLVDGFQIVVWDEDDADYTTKSVDTGTPSSNEEEYKRLRDYRRYTVQQWDDDHTIGENDGHPGTGESGDNTRDGEQDEYGDWNSAHNDWMVWELDELGGKYEKSVKAGKEAMYTETELTP